MKIRWLVLFLNFFLLLACQQRQEDAYVIGFSQCTGGDAWRQAMHQEMRREISFYPELSLKIKDAENNSEKQVAHIRQLIEEGVDLLIVSPNEAEPVTPAVEEAYRQGIPVIIVDRKTSSPHYTAYVGADNYELGKQAGHYIAEKLKGKGRILEIWGLEGSSPAIDRHRGFAEALSAYPGLQIVGRVPGAWEKSVAKANLPLIYHDSLNIDLVFAHNDVMALGAWEYLRQMGRADSLDFVGVDGLAGPQGGLQLVEDGVLKATMLYPTGGEEIIRLAASILKGAPFDKEVLLESTVVDGRNVHIMQLQNNRILNQQNTIERQQARMHEQLELYQNQRLLVYVLMGGLVVIVLLAGLVALALRDKSELNKVLLTKNREVVQQRNEIREMAQRADKANEAKVRFFTNISHEFRTPLTLILAPVEDLLRSGLSQEARKDLELVKNNATRLLRLVNQLMDFRKVETKKMKLQAAERDLIGFVKEIAYSFSRQAQKRNISFGVQTSLEKLPLYFDLDKLDKVLFNLLSNAFKFTPDAGRITIDVELSANKKEVVVSVQDTGQGMTPHQLAHAFDSFYTGETTGSMGTGLGLALTKRFVKLHKGDITAESIEGQGTCFRLKLPLGSEHLAPEELLLTAQEGYPAAMPQVQLADGTVLATPTEPEKDEQLKEYTILLIEDNEELRNYLQDRLQQNFEVVVAADGQEGLEKAFETVPDLVLSDVMMPHKSGLEISLALKQDRRTSHIPIVLLTARDALEHKIEGVQAGADLYVTKPFNYKYLLERIKGQIKIRELLKDHYSSELPSDNTSVSAPRQLDRKFISEFKALVEENIGNASLSANDIASGLGMSRVQVYRKVKALLGYSVNDYVVNVRLKKAKQLLLNSDLNISEIAYEVGFSSPAYFSTAFKSHFNFSPSDYKASAQL